MNGKRLIINADDFGLSHGITDGIIQSHTEGVVTSTSVMANQLASEYAIQQARSLPSLGLGVHLNLSDGLPVLPASEIPSLVGSDKHFPGFREMSRRLRTWQVSIREIESEFRAQIQWLKERGIMPVHADSHHHIHLYLAAAPAFRRALKEEGISRARAPRHRHWPNKGSIGESHAGPPHRRLMVGLYMEIIQRAVLRGISCPQSCITHHPSYRGDLKRLSEGWTSALDCMPEGTYELGCHPGLFESGFSETDDWHERRGIELLILKDREFKSAIERNAIELIDYRAL